MGAGRGRKKQGNIDGKEPRSNNPKPAPNPGAKCLAMTFINIERDPPDYRGHAVICNKIYKDDGKTKTNVSRHKLAAARPVHLSKQ